MNSEFKSMAGAEVVEQSQGSNAPILQHSNTPGVGTSGLKWLVVLAVLLCLVFAKPLYSWLRFSWNSDLYSHCLLIPFVSSYFVWIRRGELTGARWGQRLGIVPGVIGGALLVVYWTLRNTQAGLTLETSLFLLVTSCLCFFGAASIGIMGWANFRRFLFPALFLLFMAPFPSSVLARFEVLLQHGSAMMAHQLFTISGLPMLRDTTFFQLPGIRLQVAPECSGIHSTLVLFITSCVAGYLFLKQSRYRVILALAVVPLALLRNGFRIFTIGQLCVHYGPQMLHSYIHRRGGPIFFGLSLIPLFLLMWALWKLERKQKSSSPAGTNNEEPERSALQLNLPGDFKTFGRR